MPDLTRHMYNMSVYGVEDSRQLQDDQESLKNEPKLEESPGYYFFFGFCLLFSDAVTKIL